MIDHLSLQVRDVAASAAFHDAVLAPLGGRRQMDFGNAVGFGTDRDPDGNNVEAVCHKPQ